MNLKELSAEELGELWDKEFIKLKRKLNNPELVKDIIFFQNIGCEAGIRMGKDSEFMEKKEEIENEVLKIK